jgi:hypothetical protein
VSDIDAYSLAVKRGWACENCGRTGCERHHGLFRKDKRYPELDDELNYALVCHRCHTRGICDSKEFRQAFYRRQCERYGREVVDAWVASLPLKEKGEILSID